MTTNEKNQTKPYLLIGFGGMVGAASRYSLSVLLIDTEPSATLAANLLGCFLITYLLHSDAIKKRLRPNLMTALAVGVIGSFTTFSMVMMETVDIWQRNALFAGIYVFLSVIGGLLFCYLGYVCSQRRRTK